MEEALAVRIARAADDTEQQAILARQAEASTRQQEAERQVLAGEAAPADRPQTAAYNEALAARIERAEQEAEHEAAETPDASLTRESKSRGDGGREM